MLSDIHQTACYFHSKENTNQIKDQAILILEPVTSIYTSSTNIKTSTACMSLLSKHHHYRDRSGHAVECRGNVSQQNRCLQAFVILVMY